MLVDSRCLQKAAGEEEEKEVEKISDLVILPSGVVILSSRLADERRAPPQSL